MSSVKASELNAHIEAAIQLRKSLFVWGPPGIGKSEILQQVATKMGIGLVDFRLALMDPTDLKGFPVPDNKAQVMRFLRDEQLPKSGRGILFMDEMNMGSQLVMGCAMQLSIPPHRIGSYELPEGWTVVAAGNKAEHRAVVNRIPSTVASRFMHVDIEPDVESFINYLLDKGDDDLIMLIAFMRFRQNLFYTFKNDAEQRAFGTGRTWMAAAEIMNKVKDQNVARNLIRGTVGEGEGAEFIAFCDMAGKIPTIEDITLNPEKTPIPEEMGALYATVTMVSSRTTANSFPTLLKYIERCQTEFQAVYMRDVLRKDSAIRMSKEFTKWAIKNEKVMT